MMRIRWRWHALGLPTLLALGLVTLMGFTSLPKDLDRTFSDRLLLLESQAPHPDIVIVAIDEKSLAALGRWPWPNARHAELLANLTRGGARVVGLDLLLVEPDTPTQDQALVYAMAASTRVVLPMVVESVDGVPAPALPLPALQAQALGTGHVNLPVDDDNRVRRVFLREGLGERHWPQFAQVLYQQAAGPAAAATPPWQPPRGASTLHRQNPVEIAYAGPSGHFPRLSYVDVLSGHVRPEQLRGKLVLVGITATGLGTHFVTPTSHQGAPMPGVEIQANVLDNLLLQRALTVATPLQTWLFNLALVAGMVLAMVSRRLGPLAWVGLLAALIGTGVGVAVLLQQAAGIQLSPVTGVLAVMALGLLYWWQQWRERTRYLTRELLRFRGGHEQIGERSSLQDLLGDPLGHRIRSLRELMRQLRDVHRFVRDSLDALPDATLVCDRDGHIQLANTAAAALVRQVGDLPSLTPSGGDRRSRPGDALDGQRLLDVLRPLHFADVRVDDVVRTLLGSPTPTASVPATSNTGREYLIKCVAAHGAQARLAGWVVSIVDVTDIHEAQRQRDQAIGFLGHDMRAPQSAILSLLELRRTRPELLPADQFEERVERHARKALALSDGFIQLARAQSRDYRLQPLDLVELVRECMDDLWELSHARHITLRCTDGPACAPAQADRELFGRAIGNVLGNAIKYSPQSSCVELSVREETGHWVVGVSDSGPGMDAALQARLFQPFVRDPSVHRIDGVGLGLPFVHTVLSRHGGRVVVHSQVGKGSRFELWLPTAAVSP